MIENCCRMLINEIPAVMTEQFRIRNIDARTATIVIAEKIISFKLFMITFCLIAVSFRISSVQS